MLPPLPSLGFQPKFYTGGVSRFHLPFLYDLVALRRPRNVVVLGFEDEQVHCTFCQTAREQKLSSHCLTIRRPRAGENAEDDAAWQGAIDKSEEFFHDWGELREGAALEEAAQHADGNVDLLLIVDCASAESLRAELRAWQPKLAPHVARSFARHPARTRKLAARGLGGILRRPAQLRVRRGNRSGCGQPQRGSFSERQLVRASLRAPRRAARFDAALSSDRGAD